RSLVGEQQVAGPAGAGDRALVQVDQVPVPLVQDRLAHLAPFGTRRVVAALAAQLHRQPVRYLRARPPPVGSPPAGPPRARRRLRTGCRGPGRPFDETAQPGDFKGPTGPGVSRSAPSWPEALRGIFRHLTPWMPAGRLVICSSV